MVDMSSYDEIIEENTRQTKLQESLSEFRKLISITKSICVDRVANIYLFLNKYDLLDKKINTGNSKLEGLLTDPDITVKQTRF